MNRMTGEAAEERIAKNLLSSGLRRGGLVLVHSSLSSMGRVPGGAETVIRGFLRALGPEGTLLMPALSFERVTQAHPVFDVLRTRSTIGVIAEYFRLRSGTLRSVHPTHSACGVGLQAEELLAAHSLDATPCGPHSPYSLLWDQAGQILFLGCGLGPNTSMHAVEELVEPPYLFTGAVEYRIILADGRETAVRCRRHNFSGLRQRYDRLAHLLNKSSLKRGRVLDANVAVVESRPMWEKGLEALRKDPFYFVEKKR